MTLPEPPELINTVLECIQIHYLVVNDNTGEEYWLFHSDYLDFHGAEWHYRKLQDEDEKTKYRIMVKLKKYFQ